MPLTLRPFQSADQLPVRRLILEGLGEHFGFIDESFNPDLENIETNYSLPGHYFVVAEKDGELVGTGALIFQADDGAQMVRVSVAPKFRRQGIARQIVEHLIQTARDRQVAHLWMETNQNWASAIRLYQACGFTEFKREDGLVYLRLEAAGFRDAYITDL